MHEARTLMGDQAILARWTVSELDDIFADANMHEKWQASQRRARLVKIENNELELIERIVLGV